MIPVNSNLFEGESLAVNITITPEQFFALKKAIDTVTFQYVMTGVIIALIAGIYVGWTIHKWRVEEDSDGSP